MEVYLLLCVLSISLVLFRWARSHLSNPLPLPPGPPRYPLIGNALNTPTVMPWKTFRDWIKTYGDVIYLQIPKQSIIILGSARAATDLLEKRSDIYSDRPKIVMHELIPMRWNFPLLGYSSEWRANRREFHQYFNQHAVANYQSIQLHECRAFLKRALDNPTQIGQHIRLIYSAIILKVVYDMDITDMKHEYVQLAEKVAHNVSPTLVPGKFLVEFLPFLKYLPKWLPGMHFKRNATLCEELIRQMVNGPFDVVKQSIAEGTHGKSVAASLIERLQSHAESEGLQEELARNVAGSAYLAAADTTTAAAQSFFVAMSLYPEIQRKGQAEIDLIVGRDRLPDFNDYDKLVYVQAIMLESMRWIPVIPLGVPHRAMREDEYMGFRIPEGATILANIWAMLHDPDDYPDPERFNPGRFLKDGRINPDVRDPLQLAFGFGRRICPGRWLSSASLFMTIASVLHTLDIRPILEPDGKPYDPFTTIVDGVILSPDKIPCTLSPRSQSAERLICDDVLNTSDMRA
ncbi:hypothetical protein QCA50_004021 [Cerrena zonata]|uniref:Cytochrome P450 n=1 Tax=Cerrena zonata TaxID=2478898 RepID=A0AAW0GHZ9_9APHY